MDREAYIRHQEALTRRIDAISAQVDAGDMTPEAGDAEIMALMKASQRETAAYQRAQEVAMRKHRRTTLISTVFVYAAIVAIILLVFLRRN